MLVKLEDELKPCVMYIRNTVWELCRGGSWGYDVSIIEENKSDFMTRDYQIRIYFSLYDDETQMK